MCSAREALRSSRGYYQLGMSFDRKDEVEIGTDDYSLREIDDAKKR